ncbi:hypothetical protein, partial [Micromonospora ureilytica]|uniref:hypothetical protein n=1 Tax=Micromonospora ureilytica TaxID=709868 RepID=UPI00197CA7F9
MLEAGDSVAAEAFFKRQAREFVNPLIHGATTQLPSAFTNDPTIHRLRADIAGAQQRSEDAEVERLSEALRQRVEEMVPALYEEMRAHADMVVEALQMLPPVPSGTVYRGDWKLGGLTGLSRLVGLASATYGPRQLSFSSLTSTSQRYGEAWRFLSLVQNTGLR